MKDGDSKKRISTEVKLFIIVLALTGLAAGFSDNVFNNYFKEVYDADSVMRGIIEFPREMPGVLCVFFISALAFMGDLKIAVMAQLLSFFGMLALGISTPPFSVMLIFLCIESTGTHIFLALTDSIGVRLSEAEKTGKRLGQYSAAKSIAGCAAAIVVFFGFRTGFFSFSSKIKWIFIASAACFLLCGAVMLLLERRVGDERGSIKKKFSLPVVRKEYKYYYILALLRGVQKQIAFVYGSWVLVDILGKTTDVISVLYIVGQFAGFFFLRLLGKWLDRFGYKKIMFFDAVLFIAVYAIMGLMSWGITKGVMPKEGWPVLLLYAAFIINRISMLVTMVKTMYLKDIAVDPADITPTLSLGLGLDHIVTIFASLAGGYIWKLWGAEWVFYIAAIFTIGNLIIAFLVPKPKTLGGAAAKTSSD